MPASDVARDGQAKFSFGVRPSALMFSNGKKLRLAVLVTAADCNVTSAEEQPHGRAPGRIRLLFDRP